jgi:hypothetical protein
MSGGLDGFGSVREDQTVGAQGLDDVERVERPVLVS